MKFVLLAMLSLCGCASVSVTAELAAAKALFDKNIEAIQQRNKEAYLSCYRPTDRLVRAGPEGVKLGYAELATTTPTTGSDQWPESLQADEVEVHWVAPGLVYGAYAYEVVIAGKRTVGRSERVFIREGDRWFVAVTTAFPTVDEK